MRTFKISLLNEKVGVRLSGAIVIERRRNDTWVREREITLLTGDPSSEATIVVEDGQRLIIEAPSENEVVYDREQNAAIAKPIHSDPGATKPTAAASRTVPAPGAPRSMPSSAPKTTLPPPPVPTGTPPRPPATPTVAPYQEDSKESLADRDARQFEEAKRRAAMAARAEEPKKG